MTNRLTIDRETFNELYPDLNFDFYNDPPAEDISDEEFEDRYLSSKLWRLNNVYTIVGKNGLKCVFRMNPAQHKVYAASRKHPRVIILKSRQQGISTFWLVSYFDDSQFCPLLNIGMMAQGKAEARTLLERSDMLWEEMDDSVKEFSRVKRLKNNSDEQGFCNNSSIFIRVSFRSTTLHRLHVSEMGKIANDSPQRAREVKTGTLQALARGMTGIIESTAEGTNQFKEMWDAAEVALSSGSMSQKDFYPVFLSWLEDPDCLEAVDQPIDHETEVYFAKLEAELKIKLSRMQKNFWVVQHRELGGDVLQEYPATAAEAFTASRDGTYWNRMFQELVVRRGRVVNDLHDPNLPVDVYIDIGVEDYGVLVFRQWYRGKYRIIDEYWNQGYDMAHYMDEAMERGYNVRALKFPHDVSVREYAGGNTGKGGKARTREDIAREKVRREGWDVRVEPVAKDSIADGIENVRRIIPNLLIDAKCDYLIKCFQRYTKEWDPRLQAWKKTEVHDEWSHGAACLRYLASDYQERHVERKAPRKRSGYAV